MRGSNKAEVDMRTRLGLKIFRLESLDIRDVGTEGGLVWFWLRSGSECQVLATDA